MKNEIKNYGFCLNPVEDLKAYKLGAIELPKVILRPDSQWAGWIPIDELQHTPSFDSYGCTIYGTENIQQTMERAIYGKTNEYDERYNYNILKINPPGADPHDAAESFRNDGVVSGLFPMTSTYEEYAQPRPMPTKYVSQGIAHPYMLLHQWLWTKSQSKETRTKLIKEYLQYSPLGVSVTAWKQENGVYIDDDRRNTHWTMLYGWNDKGWLIYDSYAPHRKILSFDHNIECCKRYILVASTRKEQLSIMGKILQLIGQLVGLLPKAPIAPVIAPQPQPEPPKYLWGTPQEARKSVRVICDEEGLTLEQKNTLCATIGAESGWKPNAVGKPNYNGTRDWGICQINDGLWIGQGKDFPTTAYVLANPETCIRWMCKWWKKGKRTWWIAYKNGNYKKYL